MKDKNAAQTLLEEIEIAKLHHPSSRRDASFLSRSAALTKRLDMRGNPESTSSHFPRPSHPLFPDQEKANEQIVQTLVSELNSSRFHIKELEAAVKEYHAMFDSVKKVETILKAASELLFKLESLVTRLQTGVDTPTEDGLAPNLDTEACLQPTSHATYIVRLPDVVDQLSKTEAEVDDLLLASQRALANLRSPGIDKEFISRSTEVVDQLVSLRASTGAIRDIALSKADALAQVRRIWSTMTEVFNQVNMIRYDIREAIQQNAWMSESEVDAALLTPESPVSALPDTDIAPSDVPGRLESLRSTLDVAIMSPLKAVSTVLGPGLREYLNGCVDGLKVALDDTRRMASVCAAVEHQCIGMGVIRDDVERLQLRIEDLKTRCEILAEDMLAGRFTTQEAFTTSLAECDVESKQLCAEADAFQESLPRRVSFVAPTQKNPIPHTATQAKQIFVSTRFDLEVVRQAMTATLPIDLIALDRAVRSDSNRYSMQLAGDVESLKKAIDYFRFSVVAHDIDKAIASASEILQKAQEVTDVLSHSVEEASSQRRTLEELQQLSAQIDEATEAHAPSVLSICNVLRDQLHLLSIARSVDSYLPAIEMASRRKQPAQDIYSLASGWRESIEVLFERISDLRLLEQTRLLEEKRVQDEEDRLRAEVVERAEQERMEAERQAIKQAEVLARAEEKRLEAERRAAEEAEALARAEDERVRLEVEKVEMERRALEATEKERIQAKQQAAEKIRRWAEQQAVAFNDPEGDIIYCHFPYLR